MTVSVFFLACLILSVATFGIEDNRPEEIEDNYSELEKRLLKSLTPEKSKRTHHGFTAFDRPFDFKCNRGSFLAFIVSKHHNHFEDRQWYFGCRKTNLVDSAFCSRSEYVNNLDGNMNFQCPHNGYISGIYSYHSNHHEDRRFKFDCCYLSGYCSRYCAFSEENNWDADITYTVPEGSFLTGVKSYHHNHFEDRKFSFMSCKLVKC